MFGVTYYTNIASLGDILLESVLFEKAGRSVYKDFFELVKTIIKLVEKRGYV